MSTAKVNWGTRVGLLYLAFVAMIATLVYKSMKTDFDLVSQDYYNEELKYQEIIDAGKNQSMLSAPVSISQVGEDIHFEFPEEFANAGVKGKVHFYSEVNEQWDKHYDVDIVNGSSTLTPVRLEPALYLAKLYWEHNGKSYYQETEIKIN